MIDRMASAECRMRVQRVARDRLTYARVTSSVAVESRVRSRTSHSIRLASHPASVAPIASLRHTRRPILTLTREYLNARGHIGAQDTTTRPGLQPTRIDAHRGPTSVHSLHVSRPFIEFLSVAVVVCIGVILPFADHSTCFRSFHFLFVLESPPGVALTTELKLSSPSPFLSDIRHCCHHTAFHSYTR
jgi:hypothetical protein